MAKDIIATGKAVKAARFLFALGLGLACATPFAHADAPPGGTLPGGGLFTTGERLSEYCDGKLGDALPNSFVGGTCLGFINGAAELWLLYGAVCFNHVTKGEIADTVVRYMNAHPDEVKKHTAIVLIGIALKETYPVTPECKRETGDTRP